MPSIHGLFLTALVYASTISARTLRSRKEPLSQVRALPLAKGPEWPWGTGVITTNPKTFATGEIAAIKYEAGEQLTNDAIWAVGDGVIWRLKWDTENWGGWIADPSWGSSGRPLSGKYDAAGITFGSSTLTAYFSTERILDGSNSGNGVTRLAICQFSTRYPECAPGCPGPMALEITKEWDLTKLLGPVSTVKGSTLGLEGITFVPDYYLQANLFQDSSGKYYNPKDYPNRVDNGVFFTAYQYTGFIHGFVLNNDNTAKPIASFPFKKEANGNELIDLEFDPDTGYLWVFSNKWEDNKHRVFTISNGNFTQKGNKINTRLQDVKNKKVEGFTIEPESRCDSITNRKFAYWADYDGYLYRAEFRCGTDGRLPDLYPQPVVSPNPFDATM
jgi:hypothetical protein